MNLPYSIVIATLNRHESLATTLSCIAAQEEKPARVIVVDSSNNSLSEKVCNKHTTTLNIIYEHTTLRSAAKQRNKGSELVDTPLIGFIDDDIEFNSTFFKKIIDIFNNDTQNAIAAVGPRMRNGEIKKPGKLLKYYYWLQAGFEDETYGARLFGPGINCYPYYDMQQSELIKADWLNSTCLLLRTEVFEEYKFPDFEEYSFMEDVYLTASIAKKHAIYFFAGSEYVHNSLSSDFKKKKASLARMKIKNQRIIAKNIIGINGLELYVKIVFHKVFVTYSLLRRRKNGWAHEIMGTWF